MAKKLPTILRVKSVKSSSAQFAGLCEGGNEISQGNFSPANNFVKNKKINIMLRAMASLQIIYGLRISETLNIMSRDVSSNYQINIKGLKGSNSRTVIAVEHRDFWDRFRQSNIKMSDCYNRYHVYRIYKQYGIYAKFGTNIKNSVTHSLRHSVIQEMKSNGIENEDIKQFIGHKSIKSTLHYVNGKENTKKGK